MRAGDLPNSAPNINASQWLNATYCNEILSYRSVLEDIALAFGQRIAPIGPSIIAANSHIVSKARALTVASTPSPIQIAEAKAIEDGKVPDLYQPGDIVIIDTFDCGFEHVTVPAVIRFYDALHTAYEVNAFIQDDPEKCGEGHDIHWWTVSHREIKCKVGEMRTHIPNAITVPERKA